MVDFGSLEGAGVSVFFLRTLLAGGAGAVLGFDSMLAALDFLLLVPVGDTLGAALSWFAKELDAMASAALAPALPFFPFGSAFGSAEGAPFSAAATFFDLLALGLGSGLLEAPAAVTAPSASAAFFFVILAGALVLGSGFTGELLADP